MTEEVDHAFCPGGNFCILSLILLFLGKEMMVTSILCNPKGTFFVFEIKSTYCRRKTIMVAIMLKIMDSIRMKSDFLANN